MSDMITSAGQSGTVPEPASPPATSLGEFFTNLPKGGDLHTHLSGTIKPETLLDWSTQKEYGTNKDQSLCISINDPTPSAVQCGSATGIEAANIVKSDPQKATKTINSWSLKGYKRSYTVPPVFDGAVAARNNHFFGTFGRTGAVNNDRDGDMMLEILKTAEENNVLYLEIMRSIERRSGRNFARDLGWNDGDTTKQNFDRLYRLMTVDRKSEWKRIVDQAVIKLDQEMADLNRTLRCGAIGQDSRCDITFRLVSQIMRNQVPIESFGEMFLAFELAHKHDHVVSLNLVDKEQALPSVTNNLAQMEMIKLFRRKAQFTNVPISLHAGEMTAAMVAPGAVPGHIKTALKIAKADRIGHGIAIDFKAGSCRGLAARMNKPRPRGTVAVEINLTSNDLLLGVNGAAHPLGDYIACEIPVVLSTDDEGVFVTNLTTEYMRAAIEFGLSYEYLKNISRASLRQSFLQGVPLIKGNMYRGWTVNDDCGEADFSKLGPDAGDSACRDLLATSKLATLQWKLENKIVEFEKRHYRP